MEKTLISVDVPNVISVGIVVGVVLVLYALTSTYVLKWLQTKIKSDNSGSF